MWKPRFRFGTRTGFVVFTACCLVVGSICYRLQQTRAERAAVAQLQSMGAYVVYDGPLGRDWGRLSAVARFFVQHFARVTHVSMPEGRALKNHDLTLLESLPSLTDLSLRWPVQDDDLVILERLRKLQLLSVEGSGITDRGLAHLENQKNLHSLFLRRTYITRTDLNISRSFPGCGP